MPGFTAGDALPRTTAIPFDYKPDWEYKPTGNNPTAGDNFCLSIFFSLQSMRTGPAILLSAARRGGALLYPAMQESIRHLSGGMKKLKTR
ncbi:hypothetical protein [Nitrosospira multiformis]|nr:hypothetical protein [Nitrosospira multiformis]